MIKKPSIYRKRDVPSFWTSDGALCFVRTYFCFRKSGKPSFIFISENPCDRTSHRGFWVEWI